jgi:hypothetical protein
MDFLIKWNIVFVMMYYMDIYVFIVIAETNNFDNF